MVEAFDAWAATERPAAQADHLCFKCSSGEEFERLRRLFEGSSQYIYQSIISLRRIAIIRFCDPVQTVLGPVWFLELSDQKPDGSQRSGFEHIEVYPTHDTVADLAQRHSTQGVTFTSSGRAHHATYDGRISPVCEVRIEPEPLIKKIVRDELGLV